MAFVFTTFLFVLIAFLIILLLFSEIFLFLFVARADNPRTTIGYSFSSLLSSVFYSVGLAFQTLSSFFVTLASNITSLFLIATSLGVLIVVAEVYTAYQSSILQTLDGSATEFVLPLYKELVLPIANLVRIMYDSVICWWNSIASVERVVFYNILNILFECTIPEWVTLTQSILDAMSHFARAMINWIASGWQDDFEWKPIVDDVGFAVANLTAPFTCACADLFHAFHWIGVSVKDNNLHWAIVNILNAAFSIVRVIFTLLFKILTLQFFTAPYYGCDSSLPTTQIRECIGNTPPQFFVSFNLTCLAVTNITVAIDNLIENILIEITGNPGPNIIPDLITPIGPLICGGLHAIENVVDLALHLQLAFPTALNVQYITRLRTHNIGLYLNKSMDAYDVFFSQIDQTIVAYIGCTITNLGRALIQIIDFVLGLLKVLANDLISGLFLSDNGESILDYLIGYPYTTIKTYLKLSSNCLDIAMANINKPLGDAVRAFIDATADLTEMLSVIVSNIKLNKRHVGADLSMLYTDKQTRTLDKRVGIQIDTIVIKVAPLWNKFKITVRSLGVALGNVVRQVEIKPGCTVRDPFDLTFPPPPPTTGAGLFCNIGAVLEDLVLVGSGFIELFVDTLIAGLTPGNTLASIVDPNDPNSAFNINTHVWYPFTALVFHVVSLFPNTLGYINELVITESIVPNATVNLNNLARLILCPLEIIVIILNNVANLLSGHSIDFCRDVIKPIWNATVGRLVSWVLSLVVFVLEIIHWIPGNPSAAIDNFRVFINSVDAIFGLSEGCSGSGCTQFIDIVCDIFDVLAIVVNLIFTLFTNPGGFFKAVGTALLSVFNCVGTLLSDFFKLFTDAIGTVFTNVGHCIEDSITGFFTWLFGSTGCIATCLDTFPLFDCCVSTDTCNPNPCKTGPPKNIPSCNNIGAHWPNFTNFGDEFVACVENIQFVVTAKKRRRTTLVDGVMQRFNLTWRDEMIIATTGSCAPLMPFMIDSFPVLQQQQPWSSSSSSNSTTPIDAQTIERNARQFIYSKEARDCMFSVVTARMFEKYILFEQDPHANIVPPLWTYDTWSALNFTFKATYAFYYIASYEYHKFSDFVSQPQFNLTLPPIVTSNNVSSMSFASTTNWLEWCIDNQIEDDKFTVRLGWWVTTAIDHLLYQANSTSVFGFGPMLLKLARAVFGGTGVVGVVKTSINYMTLVSEQTNGTQMKRYLTEELPYKLTIDPALWAVFNGSARDSIMDSPFVRSMSNWTIVKNFARVNADLARNPERLRTLMAPMRYLRRIQQRMAWNEAGRPSDWHQGVVPPNTHYTKNVQTEYQLFAMGDHTAVQHLVREHYAREALSSVYNNTVIIDRMPLPPPNVSSSSSYEKRSNLPGVDLCIVNRCLNCALLERIVDDIIDLFYLCGVESASRTIEFNGDLVQSSTTMPERLAYRPNFYESVPNNQVKRGAAVESPPKWLVRESLSKQFMNHDDDEYQDERWDRENILNVERYFINQQQRQLDAMFLNNGGDDNSTTLDTDKSKRVVLIDPSVTRAPLSLDKLSSQQSVAFTFTGYIYSLINSLIKSIFGIDLQGFILDGVNALVSNSNSSTGGVGVWIHFFRRCNYIDSPRCNVGRQGYGLLKGFFYTVLALALTTALVVAFGQIPIVGMLSYPLQYLLLPFLWLVMFYPIWQALAYFNSPSCAYLAPLPILQECLADDAWVILRDAYSPCINWAQLGLPGLTTVECPPPYSRCVSLINFSQFVNASSASACPAGTTYAAAHERVFVDCTVGPYYFVDGLRNFFFILKTQFPSVYDALVSSTFFPVQYLLSLPFVHNLLVFDFGPTGVASDTWTSCNKITVLNWLPLTVTLGFALMALAIVAALFFVGLVILFLIGLGLTSLWAALISALTGYRNDVSQIDNSSAQYIQQQQQQMMRSPPSANSRPTFPQQSIQMPPQQQTNTAAATQYPTTTYESYSGGGMNHRNVNNNNNYQY